MARTSAFDVYKALPPSSVTFIYYFKKLKLLLRKKGWDRFSSEEEFLVDFNSRTKGYDIDGIKLLKKMYRRLGWNVILKRYYNEGENKGYNYSWLVKKIDKTGGCDN